MATRAESAENDEYEATVSTLYEMLGYGWRSGEIYIPRCKWKKTARQIKNKNF